VQRSRQAILDATRQLLARDGDVGALTVEAVAARARVAKTTIYRRWRDKWQLALDAMMIDMLPQLDDPVDVGDTRKELLTFVNSVVKMLATPPYGPALQGLVSRIATDADLGRVYRAATAAAPAAMTSYGPAGLCPAPSAAPRRTRWSTHPAP